MKPKLTIETLIKEAKAFCERESNYRNLPADEITMRDLAEEILRNKPVQGYLTISNALQWRLQYGRIVKLTESVEGIIRIVNKT
ncbi:MAG: hypothetical protein NUV74_18250 [Candidatus Brocadiaceae bacterium]|nr:hypothetical protein [Candidatus Brocadiaceae bacterium]